MNDTSDTIWTRVTGLRVKQLIQYSDFTSESCSSVVRAFAHGAIPHGGPIEPFLVPASAPRMV